MIELFMWLDPMDAASGVAPSKSDDHARSTSTALRLVYYHHDVVNNTVVVNEYYK
jgi:hypothetical protein